MRDSNRIDEILDYLRQQWKKNPDLRLGQIIENAVGTKGGEHQCIFGIEDDVMLQLLRNFFENEH